MRLHARREVRRPAAEVAEFFFDASNNPEWQRGMRRCEWETPPPIGVGSIYAQEASFMAKRILSRFRVTEHNPGRSITFETIESSFPIHVTRSVEPIDATLSIVSAEIVGSPQGPMALFAPLVRRFAQRSVDADYDRLVSLLD